MSNRLVIFDCDGTLVDSAADICRAMEACFTAAGLAPPLPEDTRRIVGLSLLEAVQVLHPRGTAEIHSAMADNYKAAFQRRRSQGLVVEPLFEGISEVIEAMDASGWLLGVATGKSDRGLALCLDGHGLRPRFVTLQTADRHPSKPHPAMLHEAMAEAGATPETTVMIGDTSFDIAMARAAGVRAIGVAWGYHSPDELLAHGAHGVAQRPADLLSLIEEQTA